MFHLFEYHFFFSAEISNKIDIHNTPFVNYVPGIVTVDTLWHRISVVADNQEDASGRILVNQYVQGLSSYILFLYIRNEAAYNLCTLKKKAKQLQQVLSGNQNYQK